MSALTDDEAKAVIERWHMGDPAAALIIVTEFKRRLNNAAAPTREAAPCPAWLAWANDEAAHIAQGEQGEQGDWMLTLAKEIKANAEDHPQDYISKFALLWADQLAARYIADRQPAPAEPVAVSATTLNRLSELVKMVQGKCSTIEAASKCLGFIFGQGEELLAALTAAKAAKAAQPESCECHPRCDGPCYSTVAAPGAVDALIQAAKEVTWFDWSENDADAVEAIEHMRAALTAALAHKPDATIAGGNW